MKVLQSLRHQRNMGVLCDITLATQCKFSIQQVSGVLFVIKDKDLFGRFHKEKPKQYYVFHYIPGEQFKAHKVILAACSDFFHRLFASEDCKQSPLSYIELQGITGDFKLLLTIVFST